MKLRSALIILSLWGGCLCATARADLSSPLELREDGSVSRAEAPTSTDKCTKQCIEKTKKSLIETIKALQEAIRRTQEVAKELATHNAPNITKEVSAHDVPTKQEISSTATVPTKPHNQKGTILQKTLPEENAQGEYNEALTLLQQGHAFKASQAFEVFLKKYPQNSLYVQAAYWYGICSLAQGEFQRAVDIFSKIKRDYPNFVKKEYLLLKLAQCLKALGHTQEACTNLEELIHGAPAGASPSDVKRQAENLYKQWCNSDQDS